VYEIEAGLVDRVVHLLAGRPSGLITDVDGTISPIVAEPELAAVLPSARAALEGLAQELDLVAVVSGRTVREARRLVGLEGLVYVGNHGLEVDGQVVAEARPWVARLAAVLDEVARKVHEPGVRIENKGVTGSIHYRLAAEPERAHQQLLEVLAQCALTSGLRLEEGRMVLNLLPPLRVSKGSAVRWLAGEHGLKRLVYLGDDVTDAHAFEALRAMRAGGDAETLAIGVVGPETPPSVRQLADEAVPSVPAVAELLGRVLEGLRASDTIQAGAPRVRSETHGHL
jgi:trehalose 6-phosphate phosphatase